MRKPYFQLARRETIKYVEIFVDCSLETALERNKLRKRHDVSEASLVAIYERFEPSEHIHHQINRL